MLDSENVHNCKKILLSLHYCNICAYITKIIHFTVTRIFVAILACKRYNKSKNFKKLKLLQFVVCNSK